MIKKGLAWLAEENDMIGGACQTKKISRSKYYNTGIVTTKNFKSHVPELGKLSPFLNFLINSIINNIIYLNMSIYLMFLISYSISICSRSWSQVKNRFLIIILKK